MATGPANAQERRDRLTEVEHPFAADPWQRRRRGMGLSVVLVAVLVLAAILVLVLVS